MVKKLDRLNSLFITLYTLSKPSSMGYRTVCGIGGVLISSDPSNIFTTSPVEGLMKTSSWMHQKPIFNALPALLPPLPLPVACLQLFSSSHYSFPKGIDILLIKYQTLNNLWFSEARTWLIYTLKAHPGLKKSSASKVMSRFLQPPTISRRSFLYCRHRLLQ